ncbi:39S ribosomal protein L4, mitochondrial [Lamellibrachia satsuma]|nr:39S ribosomal protein L4, mitochondrial [Lamellibrachia satsuma]
MIPGSIINVCVKHLPLLRSSCVALRTTQCSIMTSAVRMQQPPDGMIPDTLIADVDREMPPRVRPPLPLMTSRTIAFPPPNTPPKQAWLEIDLLFWNTFWQNKYKHIDYKFELNRMELRGGGRKPWPQKGTGHARHGSIRSPLWVRGGKTFGPRGPKSYFFMLSKMDRANGLRAALSVKYTQDNLHIVDSLDLPTEDPDYLRELMESRGWGLSALFVDDTDIVSRNIALATNCIKPYNMMPVYGLNVYSMLKHETLILTLSALEKIEEKLLFQMHKADHHEKKFNKVST